VRYLAGDYPSAEDLLRQALAVVRTFRAPDDEAEILNHLGTLRRIVERPDQARALHCQALTIAQTIHLPVEEARAQEGIGRATLELGQGGEALVHLRRALVLYNQLGLPEATRLSTDLAALI
jgi:tetratricopeptide (TPR) repeat protein